MIRRAGILALSALALACSGKEPARVAPAPRIASFAPASPVLTIGGSTTLTAVFEGGVAVVGPGVGEVQSGVPVDTGSIRATTIYTLTVTGPSGQTSQASTTVAVLPAVAITSFAPAASPVTAGEATTLTAVFENGSGSVDPGVGVVISGVPVSTGPLQATTAFTLTVSNGAGSTSTAEATVVVVAVPVVTAFAPAAAVVTHGAATTLTASFTGGTGTVDHGIGPVTSGVPAGTGPLSATTVYTLTVTNAAGTAATSRTTVEAVPAPSIASFAAARPIVTIGEGTSLLPVFGGGTGVVDHGVGPVTSGVPVGTGALSGTTVYTLTVTNAAGAITTSPVTVETVPAPSVASFAAARPVVTVGEATSLLPIFGGGTGVVDHGIGPVTSGLAVSTGPLPATTVYTLTVTNAAGTATTSQATVEAIPAPSVASFAAARPTVTVGEAASLVAVFAGGTGVVDHGVGPVTSGVPASTGALSSATVFTLTVTNVAGAATTALTTVETVPPPSIASFAAGGSPVLPGAATTLTAVFAGGTGAVAPGIGPVGSGTPVSTGALPATTLFTLTVTNAAGTAVTAQAVVAVPPGPDVITFTTEGDAFSPVVAVDGSPAIVWTFEDGTTSTSSTPTKSFGTRATRRTMLRVAPWSAVTRINVGYDAADGGPPLELVAPQEVSAVEGLAWVAPSLRQWCSNYARIASLDFGDFIALEDVEAYGAGSLTSVTLRNTPALRRACFEATGLLALDVSESPLLEDLRAAASAYDTIRFAPAVYPNLWHICVGQNLQITTPALFADTSRFPAIADLWIWNTSQAGALRVPSTRATGNVGVNVNGNGYTSLDLEGALRGTGAEGVVTAQRNLLTTVNIAGCSQITQLLLNDNPLSAATLDAILATLDGLGRARQPGETFPFEVDLRGTAVPSDAGRASAARLAAKGWTVRTDLWTEAPP